MMKKLALIAFLVTVTTVADAAETDEGKGTSGLPVPRFASLRTDSVNMRTGPGTRYPIEWVYTHQGLPVEITAEYEIWRRVRDPDGSEGWVHKTEITGKRTAIITGRGSNLLQTDDAQAGVVAHLEGGAVGQVVSCSKDWCKLKFEGNVKGYLSKKAFWGAYPGEVFD